MNEQKTPESKPCSSRGSARSRVRAELARLNKAALEDLWDRIERLKDEYIECPTKTREQCFFSEGLFRALGIMVGDTVRDTPDGVAPHETPELTDNPSPRCRVCDDTGTAHSVWVLRTGTEPPGVAGTAMEDSTLVPCPYCVGAS